MSEQSKQTSQNTQKPDVLIPDASGAIYVRGVEKLVHVYNIKQQILDSAEKEVAELKIEFRKLAATAIRAATAGAKRVIYHGLRGTAVAIGITNTELAASRLQLGKDKMDEMVKLGGLVALGASPEQLFEQDGAQPACIILTGPWYQWFIDSAVSPGRIPEEHMGPGKGVELKPAEPGKMKLKASAIAWLRKVVDEGSDDAKRVAAYLLEVGIKAFSVTPDLGE